MEKVILPIFGMLFLCFIAAVSSSNVITSVPAEDQTYLEHSNPLNSYYKYNDIHPTINNTLPFESEDQEILSFWADPMEMIKLVTIVVGFIANMVTVITLLINYEDFSPAILILLRHQSIVDSLLSVLFLICRFGLYFSILFLHICPGG